MIKFSKYKLKEAVQEPTHVMTFGRMNPVHSGHESVINQVTNMANKIGASHSVVVTHTNDPVKNPLTAAQKVKHIERAFPEANVQSTSTEHPNILHNAAELSNQGVKHLHLIVGSDRVGQFQNLLNTYNNKPGIHGNYNFKSITVHSAGQRDPDAEGLEGASATKMREAAKTGNRKVFHAMAPSGMSTKHKDEMMQDVVSGMKKTIKEEGEAATVADGGYIGGLGYISGNPAVDTNYMQQYINTNALAKDQQNGALLKMMKDLHLKHNVVGFKAFDPTSLNKTTKGKK
jgi:cytidyltransferase-like protein